MPAISRCAWFCLVVAFGNTATHGQEGFQIPRQALTMEQSVYAARLNQPQMVQGQAPVRPMVHPAPRALPPVAPMPSNRPPCAVEPAIFDSGYATSDAGRVRKAGALEGEENSVTGARRNRVADRRLLMPGAKENSSSSLLGGSLGRFGGLGTMSTTIAALALVLGLFLLVMALMRKTGPRHSSSLPQDVAGVLGRVPMPGRQSAYLIRLGSKLLLVAMTPTGAETLSEVTDPAEVNRLLQLCHHFGPVASQETHQPMSFSSRRAYRDA